MGFLSKVIKVAEALDSRIQNNEFKDLENTNFVTIDVETTGLNPESNRILELAIVTATPNRVVENWVMRFNPECAVEKTEIHGITDDDVRNSPLFIDLSEEIISKISGKTIIAHNAKFDLAFIRSEFVRSGWKVPWLSSICTLEASRYYQPNLGRRRLGDCCDDVGIEINQAHSALGDATATSALFSYYLSSEKRPAPRAVDLDAISNPNSEKFVRGTVKPFRPVAPKASRPKVSMKDKSLVSLLAKCDINKVVSDELKLGQAEYMEKLIEALSDWSLSDSENDELQSLATIYELSAEDISNSHLILLKALALQALEDESIAMDERKEIDKVAQTLGIDSAKVTEVIKNAKIDRAQRLSLGLKALPDDWDLGEPLRVGFKVVFTGCDPEYRDELEKKSKKLGVTIATTVTKKTNLLVTDGSYSGNKMRDASALGLRVVTPEQYEIMLKNLQPAISVD